MAKGLFIRTPYVTTPKNIDFVEKQSFLTGFFGEKRPLLTVEITHLFANTMNNVLGKALIMGFSQVAQSKEVRDYFLRGKDIASKQIEVFSSILRKEDIPTPSTWALINFMNASGIANYGQAILASLRSDLGVHYARLTAEILKYMEDGANILIDKGWMEQQPRAEDRKELAGV